MKKLFVYYSYTGSGEVVANYLKETLFIDVREVKRLKKMPKSFFGGMMTGGFLASIKHKDKLVDFDNNIDEYEEIIIGSPIWNGRVSSPINTVIDLLDLREKKVTFIFYAGSGEGKPALKRINKDFPGANVIFLKEPKKYPQELEKLKENLK